MNNVLLELLQQNGQTHPNSDLLRKFVLCLHYGWFRINGCPPDEQFTLADYLLDDERIVFDFTRLSEQNRDAFLSWFLDPHVEEARRDFLSGVKTTDYRGYTAEVDLTWWGRVTNLLFYKKKSWQWTLAPLNLRPNAQLELDYQVLGLELCEGDHGLLLWLNQIGQRDEANCYHQYNGEHGNIKRLHLTDAVVTRLLASHPEHYHYDRIINQPHPYAIPVTRPEHYAEVMHEHRQIRRFDQATPWYVQLWRWLVSLFSTRVPVVPPERPDEPYQQLVADDTVVIYQHRENGTILVVEQRPELNSMVFSGGGAKVFGHVGAYRAFEDAAIKPARFAGSSAGAIMSLLAWLGYSSNEIVQFFQRFREDNLVHYNIDRTGLSDTRALRAALDYMIVKKVNQIINRHGLDQDAQGQRFLRDHVFHQNELVFDSLGALRDYCRERDLDCEIADDLVVTATNLKTGSTTYFSRALTPNVALSFAVTLSASFPILFKPGLYNGVPHGDGGLMNNLPSNVYRDDHQTLLESDYGNCLTLVAFQFDNGPERVILDTLVDRFYRENALLNKIYGWLTGVDDPVGAWERDRQRLGQLSGGQAILIPIGNVSATQFNVDRDTQNRLMTDGYEAATTYINARYQFCSRSNGIENVESMHAVFFGIEEFLHYCCHRQHAGWFEHAAEIAEAQQVEREKIDRLRSTYFPSRQDNDSEDDEPIAYFDAARHNTFFAAPMSVYQDDARDNDLALRMRLFEAIYPVLLNLSHRIFKNSNDAYFYKTIRHAFSLNAPLECLNHFNNMHGEVPVLFACFRAVLNEMSHENIDWTRCATLLRQLNQVLQRQECPTESSFYGEWSLLIRQYERVVKTLLHENVSAAASLCESYKQREEPMELMSRYVDDEVVDELIPDPTHSTTIGVR